MSFDNLGLIPELLRAVAEQGYTTPTPIQRQAIPAVLQGHDLMATAQTGTGKTAGFSLPLLQHLVQKPRIAQGNTRPVRALILTPTRELAAQIGENMKDYGKHVSITSLVVFGGVNINPQISALRRGVDVLIATPGRLLDLEGQKAVKLDSVEILVLDEADRMLDMGFIHDIRRVLSKLPPIRQNLLFSATFSDDIRGLADTLLHKPLAIDVARRNTASEQVTQNVHFVDKKRKHELLSLMIRQGNWKQVLVFTRTKHGANRLAQQLTADGIHSAAIHGNKSQSARTKALADFKSGHVSVLVATDIAARGLDIEELPHVVNYELPNEPENYVHRIGRTGRAAATGEALSLVCVDEHKLLKDIERLLQREIHRIATPGFEPDPTILAEPIECGQNRHLRQQNGRGRGRAHPSAHDVPHPHVAPSPVARGKGSYNYHASAEKPIVRGSGHQNFNYHDAPHPRYHQPSVENHHQHPVRADKYADPAGLLKGGARVSGRRRPRNHGAQSTAHPNPSMEGQW